MTNMHVGVAVIGAAIAVFARRAAEFAHGHDGHVRHAIAQVLIKRGQRLAEFIQAVGELALARLLADFVDVRVPAADVGERDLQADIRLDQLRDLLAALPQPPPG